MGKLLQEMGVSAQVAQMQRITLTLIEVVNQNGGRMDKDAAMLITSRIMKTSLSQIPYAVTYAKSTNQITVDTTTNEPQIVVTEK